MSPVSRGRKQKRSTKGVRTGRKPTMLADDAWPYATHTGNGPFLDLERMLGTRKRPEWFDRSIARVLAEADTLTVARNPLELDQYTAELVGAALHVAVNEAREGGLWLDWWLAELATTTADRVRQKAGGEGWRTPLLLLHGLAALASPGLRAQIPLRDAASWVSHSSAEPVPDWVTEVSEIQATGDVCRMRDAYGTRFAVIAGFRYPHGGHSAYLFDIETSGTVELAGAGVFDDVDQAATAWQSTVGEPAESAHREPVVTAEELLCLSHLSQDDGTMTGNESRNVLDNWFRAQRRIHEVAVALKARGKPLPRARSLYHDLDISVLTRPFTAWYVDEHNSAPNAEATAALAGEWMEGTIPETWFAVSPRRVEFQRGLISDWIDDPITHTATALLPEWARWLARRAPLPDHLARQVLKSAGSR